MKYLILITLTLFITGCASNNSGENNVVKNKKKEENLICRVEKSTSSRISKKICRTKETIALEQQEVEQIMNKTRINTDPYGN